MPGIAQNTFNDPIKITVHISRLSTFLLALALLLLVNKFSTVSAQNLTANAYQQYALKRLDSAAVLFEKLAISDSTRADVRAMLSEIYEQQGRHEAAVREADAAVALAPRTACYWTLLGNAHWDSGLTDQALQAYLKSLDIAATESVQPGTAIAVLRSTMPYRRLEKRVKELISTARATAQDYLLLGYALQMQSRLSESLEAYQQAMMLRPEWMDPYLFASEAYRVARQPQAMVTAYEQAIEHDLFVSGKLYKAAVQDYKEALQKGTGSFAYYALGYLYEKGLGMPADPQHARKWYTYAEQMHNHVAAVKLSRLYAQEAGQAGDEAIQRIRRNRDAGRRAQQIDFKLPNGNYQTATVYVEAYPADKVNPYAAERSRLNEVYGTTVDLAALLPQFRSLEPLAETPTPVAMPADNTLSAALMASPLLSPAISTSSGPFSQGLADKERLAHAFTIQAARLLDPYQPDSLATLTRLTLASYLGQAASSPMLILQRLRDDLVANRADRAFLYYAIASVQEQLSGTIDWSIAEKWYAYAFQLHYAPAYQRLKHRYSQEVAAPVKLARLEKNWQNGTVEIPLALETPEGDVKTLSVYVMDNMGNSSEPMAGEAARLLDIFGVELPQPLLDRFNTLYQEARQTNHSYRALCRQAFLNKP